MDTNEHPFEKRSVPRGLPMEVIKRPQPSGKSPMENQCLRKRHPQSVFAEVLDSKPYGAGPLWARPHRSGNHTAEAAALIRLPSRSERAGLNNSPTWRLAHRVLYIAWLVGTVEGVDGSSMRFTYGRSTATVLHHGGAIDLAGRLGFRFCKDQRDLFKRQDRQDLERRRGGSRFRVAGPNRRDRTGPNHPGDLRHSLKCRRNA